MKSSPFALALIGTKVIYSRTGKNIGYQHQNVSKYFSIARLSHRLIWNIPARKQDSTLSGKAIQGGTFLLFLRSGIPS